MKIKNLLLFFILFACTENNLIDNQSNLEKNSVVKVDFKDDNGIIQKRIPVVDGASLLFNLPNCNNLNTGISVRVKQNFNPTPCDRWTSIYFSVEAFLNLGLYYTHQSYIYVEYYDADGNFVQLTGDINEIIDNTVLNPLCDCPAFFYTSYPPNETPNIINVRVSITENLTGCSSVSQTLSYTPFVCF